MKKLVLALAASTIAGHAFAADLIYPDPEPPVVYEPVFSWTGAYIGAQAGGSFNNGSDGLPGTFLFIPGIAAIPGTPGTPGTPGRPAMPANPGSPFIPGNPGSPGTPGTPGTPAVLGTLEYSCTAATAGGGSAGSCAVQFPNGTSGEITVEELSAAYAEVNGGVAFGQAVELQVVVTPATPGTPGTPAVPATPDTPAVPATPATPAVPATPGTPGTAGTPGTPDTTTAYNFGPNTQSFSNEEDGFAVGGHVGYNYALNPLGGTTFVIGAIADLSYVDITKGGGITDGFQTIGVEQELDYLATLRLKAGVGLDRFLVYGTGGLAFGDVETTITNTLFEATDSNSDTMVGYAVGAGTDYAVTDNFVLGLEYLYTNLGSDDFDQTFDLGGGKTLTTSADEDFDFHTVWAKASYRFN